MPLTPSCALAYNVRMSTDSNASNANTQESSSSRFARHTPFAANAERIATLESQLEQLRSELAAQRRQGATLDRVQDYAFTTAGGDRTTLSRCFGHHNELLVIHNMGERCQYCALWADGLSAFARHMQSRCAVVLATPDSPESARAQVALRGWAFPVVSDTGSSFAQDMGFEGEVEGRGVMRLPGVSSFVRDASGNIRRVNAAQFGPGDDFCSIWGMFGLLEGGAKEWQPVRPS